MEGAGLWVTWTLMFKTFIDHWAEWVSERFVTQIKGSNEPWVIAVNEDKNICLLVKWHIGED
eukprot:12929853-Prorocentrum_lima.AAC.1